MLCFILIKYSAVFILVCRSQLYQDCIYLLAHLFQIYCDWLWKTNTHTPLTVLCSNKSVFIHKLLMQNYKPNFISYREKTSEVTKVMFLLLFGFLLCFIIFIIASCLTFVVVFKVYVLWLRDVVPNTSFELHVIFDYNTQLVL